MPTSGPFFTAQHAQLRVFIGAVVAVEPHHRALVRAWFEDLVNGTRGVSTNISLVHLPTNIKKIFRTSPFPLSLELKH